MNILIGLDLQGSRLLYPTKTLNDDWILCYVLYNVPGSPENVPTQVHAT